MSGASQSSVAAAALRLIDARQVGMTPLAHSQAKARSSPPACFDLERTADRTRLADPAAALLAPAG
jgi:hypothetical protein